MFYSGIRLEASQAAMLRDLPQEAILVHTAKFRCLFTFLFAYTRCRQLGLPYPRIGFGCRTLAWQPFTRLLRMLLAHAHRLLTHGRFPDPYGSGFLRQELLAGKAGFLALLDPRPAWRRLWRESVDPVEFLIDLQKSTERPVLIVPHLLFFSKNPGRAQPSLAEMILGPEEAPGHLRRLSALFKSPGNVFAEISPPVSVQRFLARPEISPHPTAYQAALLRSEVLAQINRHRQSITGPVLKSRPELKESILNSPRLQQFMQQLAESEQVPTHAVRARAAACLDEISADSNPGWIRVYAAIVDWILRTIFDGVALDRTEILAVKRASLRGPVVFIPSHKSHVDYLILSCVLYRHDFPCPLIAAGRNLSFWPLGPLFRKGGAFFIRRTFKGDPLYSRVIAEYVHKVLEEGFNVEQFIEGGRSRTGKLLMPKLGLLSILLSAYKNGACPDLVIVPVSIGYDQVLEEKSYLDEIEGHQKKPESLSQVIQARKFLKKRYGRIYLRFGEHFTVGDELEQGRATLASMGPGGFNEFCRRLGHRVACAINRVSVVTPHALTAAAILNAPRHRTSTEELMSSVETYLSFLSTVNARLADTLVLDYRRAVSRALSSYVQRKIVEEVAAPPEPGGDTGFILDEDKRPFLEYYKNTCIAFVTPAAFTALAILQKDAFQFSASDLHTDVAFLQGLFEFEFADDAEAPSSYQVRKTLKAFIEDAVLIPHPTLPDTYNVTSSGFRKLKLFAAFLGSLLESYWVVLTYLAHAPRNGSTDARERTKKIAALGTRMYRQKEIARREALSRATFDAAAEYFAKHGVQGAEDRGRIAFYTTALQKALRCVQP
jgi:glycerol-3-phosphate O-acyltransferase